MTTPKHLAVYDAFVGALQAAPALAGGHIKTMDSTNRPMASDVNSEIRVFMDQTTPDALVGGSAPIDWSTRIRAECSARSVSGGESAFRAATLLASQVYGRVMADATLQAAVIQIDPAPLQWAEDEADTSLVACQAIFNLVHRTDFTDLSV